MDCLSVGEIETILIDLTLPPALIIYLISLVTGVCLGFPSVILFKKLFPKPEEN